MKIWIDFTNTPHVHFFQPIINHLSKEHELIFTSRDFTETEKLLHINGIKATSHGKHYGNNKIMKGLGLLLRDISLMKSIGGFDLSISAGGENTTHVSLFKDKPSICFGDNDLSLRPIEAMLCDYYFTPSCISQGKLVKFGLEKSKIRQYNGFKEQLYIADYKPDPIFLDKLPFKKFITIRGENHKAAYNSSGNKSILPELFHLFSKKNILFLPRYDFEISFAKKFENVFVPPVPLNGLDVCYYSDFVLTGAGTLAREAAIIGTPAVSFYSGKKLLKVDRELINKGLIFFSRDPIKIFRHVTKFKTVSSKLPVSNEQIKREILNDLDKIIVSLSN